MRSTKTLDLVYIALGIALISICAWISIPAIVSFTLQTFAIFAVLGLLGGKRGSIAVTIYVLLGAIGLPVFTGFKGGFGSLLGTTGGYIVGFILSGLTYFLITKIAGEKMWVMFLSMITGLIVCYIFGTAWFMFVYIRNSGAIGLLTALGWCVFPFIIPDVVKILLALFVSRKVKRFIQ